jgi:putative flippase GtrA
MRALLRVEAASSVPMAGSPGTLTLARLPVRLRQFLSFALVGVVGTAAHYLVLAILVEIVAAPVLLATTAGFVVGAEINYALNRRFTFVSTSPHHVALPKFLTVAATGALLNAAVVALFVEVALWHYLLAQLLATVTVLGWNFVANLAWTFRT